MFNPSSKTNLMRANNIRASNWKRCVIKTKARWNVKWVIAVNKKNPREVWFIHKNRKVPMYRTSEKDECVSNLVSIGTHWGNFIRFFEWAKIESIVYVTPRAKSTKPKTATEFLTDMATIPTLPNSKKNNILQKIVVWTILYLWFLAIVYLVAAFVMRDMPSLDSIHPISYRALIIMYIISIICSRSLDCDDTQN